MSILQDSIISHQRRVLGAEHVPSSKQDHIGSDPASQQCAFTRSCSSIHLPTSYQSRPGDRADQETRPFSLMASRTCANPVMITVNQQLQVGAT